MIARATAWSCAVLALVMPGPAQEQPRFRAVADEVLVDVSVRDGRMPVSGLGPGDFIVFDSGVRQILSSVDVMSGPIDVALVVQRRAFRTLFGPGGPTGVPTFRDYEALDDVLDDALRTVRELLRPEDRLDIIQADRSVLAGAAPVPATAARSSLPDDVTAAMMLDRSEPGRQRLVLAITGATYDVSAVPQVDRLAVASRTDAVLHLVAFGQAVPATDRVTFSRARGGASARWQVGGQAPTPLDPLVEATGGRMFRVGSASQIAEPLGAAISEFRTRYLLRYTPTGVPREGWHEVDVRVPSGDYGVRHRRGYEIVR